MSLFFFLIFFQGYLNLFPFTQSSAEDFAPIDTLQYIMGKFDPKIHPSFSHVPSQHTSRNDLYLRKEVLNAFNLMSKAAAKDGIKLSILSATRNFKDQKVIWENKWTGKTQVNGEDLSYTIKDPVLRAQKILWYSSMPGSSRHHWGTDMDLNALTNEYFESGSGKKVYDWLILHASQYGFCQPYTSGRSSGYHEEKWHWSYLPISSALTDFCKRKMSNDRFSGFLGSECAKQIDIVGKYILGINVECN